jgi:ADP-heptose:LPS heptosyltransferase
MIHMYVQAPPQYENMQLMGDSIAQLPFIYAMSQKDKIEITGGFNVHVMELTKGWNVEFQPLFDRADGSILLYASEALSTHIQTGRRLYMGQCYFRQNGLEVPDLPLSAPLRRTPVDLPPGIIISPYSVSDMGGNKLWSPESWIATIQEIRRAGYVWPVYVLGSNRRDDFLPYEAAGMVKVFDRPLSQILQLMRESPCVMTLDTGTNHLAHIGGVERHVMLYPACLPNAFAESPRAIHVRGPRPNMITPRQMAEAALTMLQKGAPCGQRLSRISPAVALNSTSASMSSQAAS